MKDFDFKDPIDFYVITFNRWKGLVYAHDFVQRSKLPISLKVLDMGSTNQEFWRQIEDLGIEVSYRGSGDIGPRELWTSGIIRDLGDGPYFISDADLDYSGVENNAFESMLEKGTEYPWFEKVGLTIDLQSVPIDKLGEQVIRRESVNWKIRFDHESFLAHIDTTIAFYLKRSSKFRLGPSLRIHSCGSVIHYPWFERESYLDEEAGFYWAKADRYISSTTGGLGYSKRAAVADVAKISLFMICKPLLKVPFLGFLVAKLFWSRKVPNTLPRKDS